MEEEFKGQMLKSIGFPPRVLSIIDAYAKLKNNSRSKQVVLILREYIKKNNIEELIGIKL